MPKIISDLDPTVAARVNYYYFFWKPSGSDIRMITTLTTCTDYLTDWLSYPDKNPCMVKDLSDKFTTDLTRVAVVMQKERAHQFLEYGLPLIHLIEKRNRFRLSNVRYIDNYLVFESSKQWQSSTFALSFFLKAIRNFTVIDTKVESIADFNAFVPRMMDRYQFREPLLQFIIFNGHIKKVNRGCKYVHGWGTATGGTHGNCGMYAVIDLFKMLNQLEQNPNGSKPWDKRVYESWERYPNMKKLAAMFEKSRGTV